MRLFYSKTLPNDCSVLVLVAECGRRIELYLRQSDEGTTLLALAGSNEPSKSKLQGPYETVEQAIAARNAIAQVLINEGFNHALNHQPLWELAAQRAWGEVKSKNSAAKVDTTFKPQDVFLDW